MRSAPTGYVGPYWGARAIFRDGTIDLLPDRQSAMGEDRERDALAGWLNGTKRVKSGGALAELRRLVKGVPYGSEEVIVVERDGFRLEASPQRSYGYLYLGAWRVSQ